jgi:cytochrome c
MKILTIVAICLIATGLLFTTAWAEGDIEKGKALFNDTEFAGATSGKSCNTCHPNGKGVEKAGDKKEFNIMGKKQSSLEEAVNICIEMAIKGKAIDTESDQMKDIVTYIKSLKGEMMEKRPSPGY